MELLLLSLVTAVAGGLVLRLLRSLDRHRLAGGAVFLWSFPLAGALSVVPGLILYKIAEFIGPPLPGQWGEVVFIWTVNAPVEEIAKYTSFVLLSTLLRSLREPQDGALQGAATGLGFGLIENLLYGLSGGPGLFLLRTAVSLPGHVIYGAVWGGYHGFESYQGRGRVRRWWVPLLALVPASFSHALFNTLVLVDAPLAVALFADGLLLGFGLFLFFRLQALSPSRLRRPLKQWRRAIPETEHALDLNPQSDILRRRLAAYLLAGAQPQRALEVLVPLPDHPWTLFYRAACRRALHPSRDPLPPEASLDPKLFRRLSGG